MPNVGDPILASQFGFLGSWTSYVPVLTASTTNPTMGTASSTTGSFYTKIGPTVAGKMWLTFGTSGFVAGSGTYTISLPSASLLPGGAYIGKGYLKCAGVFTHFYLYLATATTCQLAYFSTAVGGTRTAATNAAPGVWTNNDEIQAEFCYS